MLLLRLASRGLKQGQFCACPLKVTFYCLSLPVLCSLQTSYPLELNCLFIFSMFTLCVVIRYLSDVV
jgi:hypothetical protein